MLIRSVDVNEHQRAERIRALARKSDGLILHDRVLDSEQLADLMINREPPASRNVVLPTTLVRRESCGCAPGETGRTER